MYFVTQAFIYLALALIIGGAIGYAFRSCLADTACDSVRDDLTLANARITALLESQNAQLAQHVPTHVEMPALAMMTARDLETVLLAAAPGAPLKHRFGADDLTSIKGITPKTDVWLGLHGITRFSQIASLNAAEAYWLVENAPENGDSVYRDNWIAQAHELMGRT